MTPRLAALALCLTACGTTSTHRAVFGPPAPPTRAVLYFPQRAQLPADYTEVGLVQSVGRGTHADADHVIEGMRAEAAALGCDAVIEGHVEQGTAMASGVGVAVRFVPGSRPPAERPAAPWGAPNASANANATVVAPWATPPR